MIKFRRDVTATIGQADGSLAAREACSRPSWRTVVLRACSHGEECRQLGDILTPTDIIDDKRAYASNKRRRTNLVSQMRPVPLFTGHRQLRDRLVSKAETADNTFVASRLAAKKPMTSLADALFTLRGMFARAEQLTLSGFEIACRA